MTRDKTGRKPVAFGRYLKSLRIVFGDRVYDQAIKLNLAPYQVSEFDRGCGDYTLDLGKSVVKAYGLSEPQVKEMLRCIERDKSIKAARQALQSGGD